MEVKSQETLSPSLTVVATSNQVACALAEEVVILELNSGKYYGLNAVGTRIWNLIQEPRIVGDILNTILSEYDVEPDVCECDLAAVLQDLAVHGLIEIEYEQDR